ncbi:hypothetical protein [Weissella confusa]|uniref:hypothetical protein n=1 Tax=Weissella confusa TaxID=1583 RepID=UPI0013E075D0|nr:hypothetical protein [Weissella confusa]QIE77924.1 hypothetical protein G4V46_01090 [Weissella confusa]
MTSIDQIKNNINNASIFDLPQALIDAELYDEEDAHKVVEQVYADFEKGGNVLDSIVKPTFFSIFDGFLQMDILKPVRDKGITASDLLGRAWDFQYDPEDEVDYESARPKYSDRLVEKQRLEKLGERQQARRDENAKIRESGDHSRYRNGNQERYNEKVFKKGEDNKDSYKVIRDEYDPEQMIFKNKKNQPTNYSDGKQANSDHIIPVEVALNDLSKNYGLSEENIKSIINDDANLAVTSRDTNLSKNKQTNSEYVEKHSGEISESQRQTMLAKEQQAQEAMEKNTNKQLRENVNVFNKDTRDMQKEIGKHAASDGGKQAANQGLVEAIRLLLNPLTYEIKDIVKNGIDVNGYKNGAAIKYRFKRLTRYVLRQLKNIGSLIFDLLKTFLLSFIDGILSLFVGIFAKIYKIVKQAIGAAIQAFKILFGKDSKTMSPAQKGDAIVKLVGSTVIALSGKVFETLVTELLKLVGVPVDPLSGVLSTILAGVAAALFMYAMDRLDIFGVKYEQRTERIKEIFDARIADIKAAQEAMNDATVEKLAEAKKKFFEITENAKTAIQNNDWLTVNNEIVTFATSAGFEPKFESDEDFTSWLDSDDSDTI